MCVCVCVFRPQIFLVYFIKDVRQRFKDAATENEDCLANVRNLCCCNLSTCTFDIRWS